MTKSMWVFKKAVLIYYATAAKQSMMAFDLKIKINWISTSLFIPLLVPTPSDGPAVTTILISIIFTI